MDRHPDPRWPRERGASAVKAIIILALAGVAVYAALHFYGSLRVSQIETAVSQRIADSVRPTPTEPEVTEEIIKRRLIKAAGEEGAELAAEDIRIVIEPLTPENTKRLPMPARFAVNAVGQMGKNWEADAAFCSISLTARAKWGPVKRSFALSRDNMVPKSALR
jgi:hypothetical protein